MQIIMKNKKVKAYTSSAVIVGFPIYNRLELLLLFVRFFMAIFPWSRCFSSLSALNAKHVA